ncbi:MAG: BamA/TamA family outer membrane protein, partial [Phenylobacterium sp.]
GRYDASYGLASLAAGRQFGTVGEFRVGVEGGSGKASLQEGTLIPRDIDLDIGQLSASAAADTWDNPYYPTRGIRTKLEWREGLKWLGDTNHFQSVSLDASYAKGWGRHAVILDVSGGDTFQGDLPLSSLFSLGGAFSFPGYLPDELTGESYGVARAMYRYKLTDHSQNLIGIPLYVGATVVAGNTWTHRDDASFDDLRYGGNVYIGADTLIGPVFVAFGAASHQRKAFYIFVGKPF